jgi:threonylcarbamoyladenosine tRNA methylthiotransferase MtaB
MVKVITIGCRLNQAEGDQLVQLPTKNYVGNESDNLKSSNFIIVNTCAVTQEAVRTSWKIIRRHLNAKSQAPNTKLVVTGCLASLERDKMIKTAGIDMIITQDTKASLLNNPQFVVPNIQFNPARSRPIIKIQDGCPNECSFCIARIIRGNPKSVPAELIKKEISSYTNFGYQEIVLTGLNLGYYGIDDSSSLTELIKSLNNTTYRIRLSSIEPDTITDELLDLWQGQRLCRHLHIPLQSGDDRILKLMHRKYTAFDYRNLVNKITAKIPGMNIGTDIIVGFPYEDELAFDNTLKLARELPFGYLHVFPYSLRAGTESAKLPDTVPSSVKKERVRVLREVASKKKQSFREKFINTNLEILVEDNNIGLPRTNFQEGEEISNIISAEQKNSGKLVQGLSDNYLRVQLPDNETHQKGKLCWFQLNN